MPPTKFRPLHELVLVVVNEEDIGTPDGYERDWNSLPRSGIHAVRDEAECRVELGAAKFASKLVAVPHEGFGVHFEELPCFPQGGNLINFKSQCQTLTITGMTIGRFMVR